MTLTDFLLARIAEDEEAATSLLTEVDNLSSEPREPWRIERGRLYMSRGISLDLKPELAEHVARHDPARVLADCEAKRQIVEMFAADVLDEQRGYPSRPVRALRLLAAVCADHPDYRDEWRP